MISVLSVTVLRSSYEHQLSSWEPGTAGCFSLRKVSRLLFLLIHASLYRFLQMGLTFSRYLVLKILSKNSEQSIFRTLPFRSLFSGFLCDWFLEVLDNPCEVTRPLWQLLNHIWSFSSYLLSEGNYSSDLNFLKAPCDVMVPSHNEMLSTDLYHTSFRKGSRMAKTMFDSLDTPTPFLSLVLWP